MIPSIKHLTLASTLVLASCGGGESNTDSSNRRPLPDKYLGTWIGICVSDFLVNRHDLYSVSTITIRRTDSTTQKTFFTDSTCQTEEEQRNTIDTLEHSGATTTTSGLEADELDFFRDVTYFTIIGISSGQLYFGKETEQSNGYSEQDRHIEFDFERPWSRVE